MGVVFWMITLKLFFLSMKQKKILLIFLLLLPWDLVDSHWDTAGVDTIIDHSFKILNFLQSSREVIFTEVTLILLFFQESISY